MIEKYIDNTLLKPIGFKKAKSFIMDTYKFGFRGLVVDEYYFDYALKFKEHFPSTPTKLIQVFNFPMGNNNYDVAIDARHSADEYDVVLPLYHMKDNNLVALRTFIEIICARVKDKPVKFIIEENLWAWNEMVRFIGVIYKVVRKKKIKNEIYIKSNTGFRGYSPLEERLKLPTLVNEVSKGRFKTKISAGIKTLGEAKKVVSTRAIIGTSNGLELLKEEQK